MNCDLTQTLHEIGIAAIVCIGIIASLIVVWPQNEKLNEHCMDDTKTFDDDAI